MPPRIGKPSPARWTPALLTTACAFACPSSAHAGMPSYNLHEIVTARLQVISFFLVLSLVLAFVFQRCWNALASDFALMPRLGYKKSVAVIFVASLFCGLILTMISGARELMTPGAWVKTGAVYKLQEPKQNPAMWLEHSRRRGIEQFRDALWDYARRHDGRLPEEPFGSGIPEVVWRAPDLSGSAYGYLARRDRKVLTLDLPKEPYLLPPRSSGIYVLAYEPVTFGEERFVLFSSGEILRLSATQLYDRVDAENAADYAALQKSASQL